MLTSEWSQEKIKQVLGKEMFEDDNQEQDAEKKSSDS